jgi:hypothetical protein
MVPFLVEPALRIGQFSLRPISLRSDPRIFSMWWELTPGNRCGVGDMFDMMDEHPVLAQKLVKYVLARENKKRQSAPVRCDSLRHQCFAPFPWMDG